MKAERIVTALPLRVEDLVTADRVRSLDAESLREILRGGAVRFVVADVGAPLRWYTHADCFALWKNEVAVHLVAPDAHACLDDFADGYFYRASLWVTSQSREPLVVLEKNH